MTDKKPYLLRAIYEWISDNDCTPQIIIAYPKAGWVSGVPEKYLSDETLVLNISMAATRNLSIEQDYIYFDTRFSGESCSVCVDILAISGIFARENSNDGMFFELPPNIQEGKMKKEESKKPKTQTSKKATFKFVK